MTGRLLRALDTAAHLLRRANLLPKRAEAWICDRYELHLGVTPDELRRAA